MIRNSWRDREIREQRVDESCGRGLKYLNRYSQQFRTCAAIIKIGYSRIPVYAGTLDDVRGILLSRILPYLNKGAAYRWQSLMQATIFRSWNEKNRWSSRRFPEIKSSHGDCGWCSRNFRISNVEDILEEIVGDMPMNSMMKKRCY